MGGHEPVKVDVRVIAATHRDLRNEIEAGRFREDLFFRLAQVRVLLAPLRDRPEDIPVLCQKLLPASPPNGTRPCSSRPLRCRTCRRSRGPATSGSFATCSLARPRCATGSVIRRADVAGEGFGFRGTREERSALDLSGPFAPAKEHAIERFESAYLAALMKRCGGNLSRASREADLARHYLRELLKRRGLYGMPWSEPEEP